MAGGRGAGRGAIIVGCGWRTACGGMDRMGGGGGGETGRTGGPEVGLTAPGGTDTGSADEPLGGGGGFPGGAGTGAPNSPALAPRGPAAPGAERPPPATTTPRFSIARAR